MIIVLIVVYVVNIQMRKFFHDKIHNCSRSNDPKKAWTLINTLLGKNNKPNNLSEYSVNDNLWLRV